MLMADGAEAELIVALAFVARLVERREGPHGAADAGVEPFEDFGAARRLRDDLHELRAIGLVAAGAARRCRPIQAMCPELVLSGELCRVNLALDVLHTRDLRFDAFVLEEA